MRAVARTIKAVTIAYGVEALAIIVVMSAAEVRVGVKVKLAPLVANLLEVVEVSHFRHAQDDGAEERIVEVERVGSCDLAVRDKVCVVAVKSRELGRFWAKMMLCVERRSPS